MSLLVRELTEQVDFLVETTEDGKKSHFITGRFLVAEEKNKNGRIYPLPVLEKEVNRYITEAIEAKRAYGELGHPPTPQINLERVSHIITELKRDGNYFIGKAKLTETPMGDIARGLLSSGAKLGVSSRGLGSLKPDKSGAMIVQEDFRIATAADIVADPSAPGAFVEGIMENVNWVYDAVKGTWKEEKLHEMKQQIDKMSLRKLEEQKLIIFENFLGKILLP